MSRFLILFIAMAGIAAAAPKFRMDPPKKSPIAGCYKSTKSNWNMIQPGWDYWIVPGLIIETFDVGGREVTYHYKVVILPGKKKRLTLQMKGPIWMDEHDADDIQRMHYWFEPLEFNYERKHDGLHLWNDNLKVTLGYTGMLS